MEKAITIGNGYRTYAISYINLSGVAPFEDLNRKFGWHTEVFLDGVPQGITFDTLAHSYMWPRNKRYIRKVVNIRQRILNSSNNTYKKFYVLDENRIYLLMVEQMKRIVAALGKKAFKNPSSLWEQHANEHGVVVSRDYYESHKRLLKDFEVLPWPMFMGHYDENYKEVLVGIGRNNNGLPIVPREEWE